MAAGWTNGFRASVWEDIFILATSQTPALGHTQSTYRTGGYPPACIHFRDYECNVSNIFFPVHLHGILRTYRRPCWE